jgi:anti-sigma B factor antagonist
MVDPSENPDEFTLATATRDGCEVVTLGGELDLVNAARVSDTLDSATSGERKVVVDLTTLSFIDSSGIHAILAPRSGQQDIVIVCPPGNVRRVFDVTRIDQVVPLYETLDEALARLA